MGQYSGKFDAVVAFRSLVFWACRAKSSRAIRSRLRGSARRFLYALVVPVCLGLGWILLVIPLAAR